MRFVSIWASNQRKGQSDHGRITALEQEDQRVLVTGSRQLNSNGKAEFDMRSARSSSPPASVEPSIAPHPKSYMEINVILLPNLCMHSGLWYLHLSWRKKAASTIWLLDQGCDYLKYEICFNLGIKPKERGVNDFVLWGGKVGNIWRTTGDINVSRARL
ncbi:hypothetical protein F0562_006530 [Nyssa sinensis]|uniref:Uncharacterized protein n=1 Tax=Nyssa sinensis TaxID=561372 RepID=A0A5J5AL97_9ASTE|nr:hypothetical protein F0562_006530 [Nyssa sinensis]